MLPDYLFMTYLKISKDFGVEAEKSCEGIYELTIWLKQQSPFVFRSSCICRL